MGQAAAAVTTAADPRLRVSVWDQPHHTLPHSPTGTGSGGRRPGKCSPLPWDLHRQRPGGGRESEGEKVPGEKMWVPEGGWGWGGEPRRKSGWKLKGNGEGSWRSRRRAGGKRTLTEPGPHIILVSRGEEEGEENFDGAWEQISSVPPFYPQGETLRLGAFQRRARSVSRRSEIGAAGFPLLPSRTTDL